MDKDDPAALLLSVTVAALVIAGVAGASMLSMHSGFMGQGMMGGGMMGGGWMGGPRGDTSSAPVDTTSVEMLNSLFQPSVINVSVGSTVTWTNGDSFGHTVTSDDRGGPLDSPLIGGGGSWTYTFTAAGTYRYHCTPHSGPDASGNYVGMVGRVVVA